MRADGHQWTLVLGIALTLASGPGIADLEQDPLSEVYRDYQTLLDRHLSEHDLPGDGLVSAFDYAGALEHAGTGELLERQRRTLAGFDTDQLEQRETANAFWLNAYNFFMIAHILEDRPGGELVESVWDYGGRINPFRDLTLTHNLAGHESPVRVRCRYGCGDGKHGGARSVGDGPPGPAPHAAAAQ